MTPPSDYSIDFAIKDIYALHHCVLQRIKLWSGGDPEEQEHLYYLRDSLYRIILDYRFHNL
jgi:hypothetical protein